MTKDDDDYIFTEGEGKEEYLIPDIEVPKKPGGRKPLPEGQRRIPISVTIPSGMHSTIVGWAEDSGLPLSIIAEAVIKAGLETFAKQNGKIFFTKRNKILEAIEKLQEVLDEI